jgi:uncharacterized protein
MKAKERLEALTRAAARRPLTTVAIVLALALGGGVLALGLTPSVAESTFVSSSSSTYRATQAEYKHFGGNQVVVLIRESLPDLVSAPDLGVISRLEACFAGQVLVPNQTLQALEPGAGNSYGGQNSPCAQLRRANAVQVVYGPGTFLNQAVSAVNNGIRQILSGAQQAATTAGHRAYGIALSRGLTPGQAAQLQQAAQSLAQQQQMSQLYRLALQSGISLSDFPVSIGNLNFISQIVFDQTRGPYQPKAKFAYIFPTPDSALIQVRLKSSLSTGHERHVIGLIRRAIKMPIFQLEHGGTYIVSGEPVVVTDLASQVSRSIVVLLIAALVVMATTLLVVFRKRLRLLPLAIALSAAGITFGAMALAGATLTMASIAVLPIMIGLAVDYAIQYQSRVQEAQRTIGRGELATQAAIVHAGRHSAPTIGVAALATATGFLVLLLSPVPMVRSFGILLVVGIAISLACALTAGSAALVLAEREEFVSEVRRRTAWVSRVAGPIADRARFAGPGIVAAAGRIGRWLAPSVRGAGEILTDVTRVGAARLRRGKEPPTLAHRRSPLVAVMRHPGRALAIGALLAVLGWVADTQTSVQTDVTKLVPSSMPALRDLRELEQVTGVSGEIDVTVHAPDGVANTQTIGWMTRYENALLTHFGYVETKGCAVSTLCPALSLPDLFSSGAGGGRGTLPQTQIDQLLQAVPPYFKQAVITADGHDATLAFGIRLMPLSRQQRVIDYMRSQLHPPRGVTASLAGLPVLAAQANTTLSSSSRRLLTLLAGLAAVGLVLLAVFRRPRRALVPLIPIALATGWSALILYLIGIPLNPMSATLGTLVIAISTEFSVLLSERFGQERESAEDLQSALRRTYRSTGAAVLASGITAIAGFGVLVLSNITMLRDFGFVTVIDLTVSLIGVMLVLPAVLTLSEHERGAHQPVGVLRRLGAGLLRPRRRARVA